MRIRPNRLLVVLLTLLLAYGPVGSALAMSRTCDTGCAVPMGIGHPAQSQRSGAGADTSDHPIDAQQAKACGGSTPDCCSGSGCAVGACSAAVVAITSSQAPELRASAETGSSDHPQLSLSNTPTSVFRPPRI